MDAALNINSGMPSGSSGSFPGGIVPIPPSMSEAEVSANYPGYMIGYLLTFQSDPSAELAALFERSNAKQRDAERQLAEADVFESLDDAKEAGRDLLASADIQELVGVSRRMSMWYALFKKRHKRHLYQSDGRLVPGEYLQLLFTAIGGERDPAELAAYFKRNSVKKITGHKAFEGEGYYIATSEDAAAIMVQQGTGSSYIKVAFDTLENGAFRSGIKSSVRRWIFEAWNKGAEVDIPDEPRLRTTARQEAGTPASFHMGEYYSNYANKISAVNKPRHQQAEVTVSGAKVADRKLCHTPGCKTFVYKPEGSDTANCPKCDRIVRWEETAPSSLTPGTTTAVKESGADLLVYLIWATLGKLGISTNPNHDPVARIEQFASRIDEIVNAMPKIAIPLGIKGFRLRPSGDDPLAGHEFYVFYS